MYGATTYKPQSIVNRAVPSRNLSVLGHTKNDNVISAVVLVMMFITFVIRRCRQSGLAHILQVVQSRGHEGIELNLEIGHIRLDGRQS